MKNPTTLCENYFYHVKKLMCLLYKDLLRTNKKKVTDPMEKKKGQSIHERRNMDS